MNLSDEEDIHAHTFKTTAIKDDRCSICYRQFAPGETIRDRRSTIDIDGTLFCWNGVRCDKNLPAGRSNYNPA